MYCVRVNFYFLFGMHGRSKTPTALAFDTQGTPLPARPCCVQLFFFFVSRLASTRVKSGRSAPIRAKLVRIGRNHRYLRQPANSIRNSKKKKKVRNAPFGRNNNKRCKMHRLDKNNKTLYHLQSAALSFLTSHLQLSLTLWSLIFVLHATACCLCSPSPLSHTISLSHSHNLTHILGDPLSSLKLKYQSQAFNLSFS